jgi:hypothetical protein
MDARLSEYGWGGTADCSISDSKMIFDTEGLLYNANTFKTNKTKITVIGDFVYNGLDTGLVLWYNNELGYIRFIVNQEDLFIERNVRGIDTIISKVSFEALTPPSIGEEITLKAVLHGTNLKCFYNDNEVFNIEQSLFREGCFGVYGSTGDACAQFSIKSNAIGNWNKHIADGAYIDRDGQSIKIINPSDEFAYIEQTVEDLEEGTYTISFSYSGSTNLQIMNNEEVLYETQFADGTKAEFTFNVVGISSITIRVGSNTPGTHIISEPQLEFKSFSTAYTYDIRDKSLVTFPAEKFNKDNGGIGIYINPTCSYETVVLPIFFYNNSFKLIYSGEEFVLDYGQSSVIVSKEIEKGKWYYISCIWNNGDSIFVDILDEDEHTSNSLSIEHQNIESSNALYIGCDPYFTGNLMVDNLVVYKNQTTLDKLLSHKDDREFYDENVIIKSKFDKNTLIYNKNKVAIPVSKSNSPIIIESSDGTLYVRVYFVDSGRYVLYNVEQYEYVDSKTFKIAYNNILNIEAFTYDMDKIFHDISVDGDLVTINDLTDEHKNKLILIKYTVRNSYVINYNEEYNQHEIEYSNVDGNPLYVYCDHSEGTDTKLLQPIQLNPFKSVNNSGFIFLEESPRKVKTFDIKITPDSLVADGYDTATITIDCLSENGIPTSNVRLEVTSVNNYGTITRYVSPSEQEWLDYANEHGEEEAFLKYGHFITDEHRAGRFIYKYKAGKFAMKEDQYEIIDEIIIRDTESGIGTRVPIRLVRES